MKAYFAGGCFWCMTPVFRAYGAKKVVCIDVQKPAAFEHEMERIRRLGGEIVCSVW